MDLISNYQDSTLNLSQELQLKNNIKPVHLIRYLAHLNKSLKHANIVFNNLKGISDEQILQEIIQKLSELNLNLNQLNTHYLLGNQSIQFSIKYSLRNSHYKIYVKFVIDFDMKFIRIRSTPLKNGKFLSVNNVGVIHSLSRHLLVHNARLHYGSVSLHPILKQIWLTTNNQFYQNSLNELIKNSYKFILMLQRQTNSLRKFWQQNLEKILYLMNQKSSNQQDKIKQNQDNKYIQKISTYVRQSHIQYPFMYARQNKVRFKQLGNRQIKYKQKQFQNSMNQLVLKNKPLIKQVRKIIKIFKKKSILSNYKNQQYLNQCSIQEIKKILSFDVVLSRYPIYTQIEIKKISSQYLLAKSFFSKIYLYQTISKRVQDNKQIQNKIVGKFTDTQRLENQKYILNIIKNQKCLFISRYYYSQLYSDRLFVQFCPQRSLDYYLKINQDFISLQTKLFFLYQVTIGLRFLRDFNIVHIDLKPHNILTKILSDREKKRSTFILRLIDFGQSFTNPGFYHEKRGYTIPYSAPELVNNFERFDQKTDVFSFGVMALELLFNQNYVDIKRLGCQSMKNEDYLKFYSICFEKCAYYGFNPLMQILYYFCLKCINPSQNLRPTLDWVCVIIKQSLYCIQKIYQ